MLLPKPDGGRRPIGLFDSLVRIWLRARSTTAKLWEAAHPSAAIYGGRGCGAQRAAWISAFHAEAAAICKRSYGQVLIDLVKAFERIPHRVLLAFAVTWDYNLGILRLSIRAYRLDRTVGMDGVYSRSIRATRGITAGAGMATTEIRLIMLHLVQECSSMYVTVRLVVYVDDMTLEADGESSTAIADLAEATAVVVEHLEQRIEATISPTKSVYQTNTVRAQTQMQRSLGTNKVSKVSTAKMLGVQMAAGTRRRTGVLKARLKCFRARHARYRALSAAGIDAKQAAKCTGTPAFCYGAPCTGVADTTCSTAAGLWRRLSALALAARGSTGGRWSQWN